MVYFVTILCAAIGVAWVYDQFRTIRDDLATIRLSLIEQHHGLCVLTDDIDALELKINTLIRQGVSLMAKADDIKGTLGEINTATNDLAARIDKIIGSVSGGLTAAEADAVGTDLAAVRDRLQGLAADPANPVPAE